MPYPLFIALRYLKGKHKRAPISLNTVISIGGVALGVMTLIVVLSVMSGFESDLKKKILGTNSPIIVTSASDKGITDYGKVTDKIASMPHVVSVTPFTYSEVMLTSPTGVSGIILKGINPEHEGKVTELGKNMVNGSIEGLKGGPDKPGIILGRELASMLGVITGDVVRVVSPFGTMTPLGMAPKLKEFTVRGIFDTGMYEYDSKLAYISIPQAQEFFGLGDAVTGFEVRIDDIDLSGALAHTIQDKLGFPFRARDWQQMNRSLFSALKLEKITMFVILVLIILVASFNIVSTLIMIVIEKAREIAILKSMGATRAGIMSIFMINGVVIGVVGTLIGLVGGYLICALVQNTDLITLPSDIYYIDHLPVRMNPKEFLAVCVSAVTISFCATLYPSWQAAKLDPLEALRYE
ncbi:MAG TPA: lipoprotein-releasing ABC transporter permease subunit [Nitrospirota bacterium]|nr:lipoprotein-releasing ABC transporter permease subunit [Nitrospirota bacterium]